MLCQTVPIDVFPMEVQPDQDVVIIKLGNRLHRLISRLLELDSWALKDSTEPRFLSFLTISDLLGVCHAILFKDVWPHALLHLAFMFIL